MKRYEIVPMIGSGTDADPIRPNTTGSYVMVGPQVGQRALIKRALPDGTAATAGTVADLDDSNPDAPATDVTATSLSGAQKTALKTFLTNQGIDVSQFDNDGVDDRRKLLRFLLRRWLGWQAKDLPTAISGYDVSG